MENRLKNRSLESPIGKKVRWEDMGHVYEGICRGTAVEDLPYGRGADLTPGDSGHYRVEVLICDGSPWTGPRELKVAFNLLEIVDD